VAFIVGGDNTNSVEVYSPEGKCQHKLAPVPNEAEGTYTFAHYLYQTLEIVSGI
jgi:hypothetical protein